MLVGPCGPCEELADCGVDLALAFGVAGHGVEAFGEFVGAGGEVFGHIIQDLRAQVAGGFAPAGGGVHRFDGVADILAVGEADMPQKRTARAVDGLRIAAVWAGLFAADIELGGAVERVGRAAFTHMGFDRGEWLALFGGAGVGEEPFPAAFAAEAAFAHAAEARRGIEEIGRVHPDDACGKLRRDVEGEIDVFRPDRRGEAVAGVIRQLHGLGWRAEGGGNEDGAEDFLLHQRIGGGEAGDQRGRVEAALGGKGRGALVQLAARTGVNHFGDPRVLNGIDDGAHVNAFVERIADAQAIHAALELGMEAVGDALLHQKPRTGAADLPLIEPDCIDEPLNGAVEIGVVKDDVGGLAAQFQGQRLAAACGGLADAAANGGRAGEGDLVNVGVGGDHLAHGAVASDDIHDAARDTCLAADIGKEERCKCGVFGGLQHHGIACRERWRDLPREHQKGEVPRHDLAADAKCRAVRHFVIHQLGEARVEVEMALGEGHVYVAAFADRLAVIEGFEHGEEAAVFLQEPRDGVEHAGAGMAVFGPFLLRLAGGGDRGIDIGLRCLRHMCEHFAGGGVAGFEGLPRFGECAVNEMAEAVALIDEPGKGFGGAFGGGAVIHRFENLFDGAHLITLLRAASLPNRRR